MMTRALLEFIFSAANIERWNDHPHPAAFSELGKQAHKMVIAWVLSRYEEDAGKKVDRVALIEGGIFEFLHRVAITDIRPPLFHKLMEDNETREQLNNWVYHRLEQDLKSLSPPFAQRFYEYHRTRNETLERDILRAAHFLATKWEFDFIDHWSAGMYGLEKTRQEIEGQIRHIGPGVAREILIQSGSPKTDAAPSQAQSLWAFISLVGQLTFQKRWAQTPRVPQTSVLGHLFFVAAVAYLISLKTGACPGRRCNNFFAGLFHDLPEVFTRDIISPVKTSVEGLEKLIHRYEREAMEQDIFPLLPASWSAELRYCTEDEFADKTRFAQSSVCTRHENGIPPELNRDELNPVDGRLIEICDKLAAYIEASASIRNGVHPPTLEEGKRRLYERFSNAVIQGYPIGRLFELF